MLATVESLILSAAPGFQPMWQDWCRQQEEQVARYGEEDLPRADYEHQFLTDLGRYLGARVAAGDAQEFRVLLSVLEPVFADADNRLVEQLTIDLFEGVILAVAAAGCPAAVLDEIVGEAGSMVRIAYEDARFYLRGPADAPDAPHWVRP